MAITSRLRGSKPVDPKQAPTAGENTPKVKMTAARRSRTSAVRKRGVFATNVAGWAK